MPITKNGSGVIQYTQQQNPFNDGVLGGTGVVPASQFAVADSVDPLKQIQFDASLQATNSAVVFKTSSITPGSTVTLTMPNVSGQIATTAGAPTASFTTIQTDAGTNPVADSVADTLQLTSSDASITITGTDTPDKVNFVVPAFVGDSGSGGVKGLVPAPSAGDAAAGKLLKADGTWSAAWETVADTTHTGLLLSADWNTFNGKQAAGNYLTALTGDVTASGPGSAAATIASHAVTNAKSAQMAAHTHKGNNTGSTADPIDLTVTQLTAELNVFGADAGSGGVKGLVPATASGDASKYLKGDGSWSSITGSVSSVALSAPPEFSVSGSPITTSGTLTFTKASQNANIVYAGPSSGGAAAPTFRALAGADLPAPSSTTLGGTRSIAAVTSNFLTSISTSGIPTQAQPAFSDISGTATNAQLANVATSTFKGRATAGTGAPEDLTATQATGLLNAVVGDSGSGGTKGLVPAPASGDAAAGKFLKADGTFAVPAGGSAPRSELYYDGGNGLGGSSSGETFVRNFTNARISTGSDMTYTARTTTNGDKVTINTAGLYSITYFDTRSSGAGVYGITVNDTQLSSGIYTQTYAQGRRPIFVTAGSENPIGVTWTTTLAVNDVIRFMVNDTASQSTATYVMFGMIKVNS